MDSSLFPFPYVVPDSAKVTRGSFIDIPTYCKRNLNSHTCKQFYLNLDCSTPQFHRCPYGFGVEVVKFGNDTIIFTCLNVEKYSVRKDVQKRISERDFLPKLSVSDYEYIKDNARVLYENSQGYLAHKHAEESEENRYQEKIDGLNNTFHELRKLNKQLKSQVESLIFQSDTLTLDRNNINRINYLSKNIFHSSQLISIRLNTYDFTLNPELSLREEKSKMHIHRKFVKISYNLREYANNKHIRINIVGKSYGYIYGNDVFELLPFLLLDNAIKYSMQKHDIEVTFKENVTDLVVTIKSYSIRPDNHELQNLKMRGVRGKNTEGVQGQGIGLYIADAICKTHNIDLSFKVSDGKYFDHNNNDIAYSDFYAILKFNDFERGSEEDYQEETY